MLRDTLSLPVRRSSERDCTYDPTRHCARLPRRRTLINMFGIVWSLVEILSRAAGTGLLAPRCFAIAASIVPCDEIARRRYRAEGRPLCPRDTRGVPRDETRSPRLMRAKPLPS